MDSLTLLYDFGKTKVLQRFFIAKGCKRKHRFLQVRRYFTYSTEFIIWARKSQKVAHYYNYDLMKQLNGDKQMTDVWQLPARVSQGQVIDILIIGAFFNSYSLQYYSFWKGKIGFTRTGSCFWGQRQFTPGVTVTVLQCLKAKVRGHGFFIAT